MTIRRLLPLMLVALGATVFTPERASAQCWYCDDCWLGDKGETCVLMIPFPLIGFTDCLQTGQCDCTTDVRDFGFCFSSDTAAETAEYETELAETMAAIRTSKSIPSDGSFFFARQGADFVIRRKCDVAEVGRVAVSEVESVPVAGAG